MLALRQLFLSGAALTLAFILLFFAIVWPFTIFLSYAGPPCESDTSLQIISRILAPCASVAASLVAIRAHLVSSWKVFFISWAIVGIILLATAFAYRQNEEKQRLCEKRDWNEAATVCGLDQQFYRAEKSVSGNVVYKLVPPGKMDSGYLCIEQWSRHHGELSLIVDDRVYEYARRQEGRIRAPEAPAQ